MRFYRCETTPPTIARTQGDAKATGASYGPWEVDTSHAGLTDAFNKIISEVALTPAPPKEPGLATDGAETSTISPPARPKPAPVIVKGTCTSCGRLEIEEDIWRAMDAKHLDQLEKLIAERRAELAKAAEAVKVNPPARRRTR